jgi:hypothetical protein
VTVAIGLALTLAFGGCSFCFVQDAPAGESWPKEHFNAEDLAPCTESRATPALDAAITVGLLGGAGLLVERHSGDNEGNALSALAMVLLALPYALSTIYGFEATSQCRRYRAGLPYQYPIHQGR